MAMIAPWYTFNKLSILLFQTIKCLLIVPNPESALNEEAGKLLLENYDDYFQRAKMMTEIHARHCYKSDQQLDEADGCSSSKKAAPDKKLIDKKKEKLMKEKRKILKRLWSCWDVVGEILKFLPKHTLTLSLTLSPLSFFLFCRFTFPWKTFPSCVRVHSKMNPFKWKNMQCLGVSQIKNYIIMNMPSFSFVHQISKMQQKHKW